MENKKPVKVQRSPQKDEKNFRLVMAYVGGNYQGWQKQAVENGPPTVQEQIEKAARKVFGSQKVSLHGSGRTDSGVHARAQVAHLKVNSDFPTKNLCRALNAHLPEDIRITEVTEEKLDFHAQLDVESKVYRYFILHTNPLKMNCHWPFLRPFAWLVSFPLDYKKMESALKVLEGSHDFRSFQNRGTPMEDTTRKILSAALTVHPKSWNDYPWCPPPNMEAQLIEIRIHGTGFLKQMVRTIVGTVVEIGRGRFEPEEIATMLSSKDRRKAGTTAPPYGLFLDRVFYPES